MKVEQASSWQSRHNDRSVLLVSNKVDWAGISAADVVYKV